MTTTSGYQSQVPSTSVYSPFNRTGSAANMAPDMYGYQTQQPQNLMGNQSAAHQAPMGSDMFLPVSSPDDIDKLSSSIDSKIAQIRQAFSQPQPAAQMMAPTAMAGAAAQPVSQADIQWATNLQTQVQSGQYQPTAQDMARYEDIANRVQAQQAAPQTQAAPQGAVAPVSKEELDWAMELEAKNEAGTYQPTAQDKARYEDIARRLQNQQSGQAAPAAAAPQAVAQVTQAEIDWAKDLEAKNDAGTYTPNAQDKARYEDIFRRLQAQVAASQGGAQAPAAVPNAAAAPQQPANRDWANWSRPFGSPQVPNMPQPIAGPSGQPVVMVPTSLRGQAPAMAAPQGNQQMMPATLSPQSVPQATAPQMPAGLTQEDLQWAYTLEQRHNTQGYQPNPQELARYNQIAASLQQQSPQQQTAAVQGLTQQPAPAMQPQARPQQPAGNPSQVAGVSQEDLQWAVALEQRAQTTPNFQATPQEIARHEDILRRVNAQVAAQQQQPQQPAMQPQYQQAQPGGYQAMTAPAPQVQVMPQNYPMVQQGAAPQWIQPSQSAIQQPAQMAPQGYQQGYPQQPGMPNLPGGQQPQKPGFMDKLKTAWGTLWS